MRLKDRVAIVTGGGVGIGKAYAHGLAKEGAKVVVADIQSLTSGRSRRRSTLLVAAMAVAVDVICGENPGDGGRRIERIRRIDILVNNAGLYSALKKKAFMEIDTDEWDRVMAVNVKGLFLCVKAGLPSDETAEKGQDYQSSPQARPRAAHRSSCITSRPKPAS